MAIKLIQYFRDAKTVSAVREEMTALRVKTQHLIDALSGTEDEETGPYRGNKYRTYRAAVVATDHKYNATDRWGVLQTGNIIDLRAAFIIARGIKLSVREKGMEAEKELKFAEALLEYNDLDKEMVQEFAKEAEIEGKILMKIDIDKTPKVDKYKDYNHQMVAVRYVSWLDKRYKITADPEDYKKYEKASWDAGNKRKAGELKENQFVYKKFGGRISDPNSAQAKIHKCLTQIDGLDHALRDWREVDRIYGGPILYMKCETKEEVNLAMEMFENKNFKLKKMLAGTGVLGFVKFDVGGVNSFENEIITLSKMISGTTGVSVQYLGFVELLKNRSTSDDLREMLSSATVKERTTWEGAYEELIEKSIIMFNEAIYSQKSEGKKLNPSLIKVTIPVITKQHWENIKDVWLPSVMAGKISEQLYLEQLPGVDVDEEMDRKEEREQSEFERIKKENADIKADQTNKPFGKSAIEEEEE